MGLTKANLFQPSGNWGFSTNPQCVSPELRGFHAHMVCDNGNFLYQEDCGPCPGTELNCSSSLNPIDCVTNPSPSGNGVGCGITVRASAPLTAPECLKASGPTYFVLANSCVSAPGYTANSQTPAATSLSSNTILGYPA